MRNNGMTAGLGVPTKAHEGTLNISNIWKLWMSSWFRFLFIFIEQVHWQRLMNSSKWYVDDIRSTGKMLLVWIYESVRFDTSHHVSSLFPQVLQMALQFSFFQLNNILRFSHLFCVQWFNCSIFISICIADGDATQKKMSFGSFKIRTHQFFFWLWHTVSSQYTLTTGMSNLIRCCSYTYFEFRSQFNKFAIEIIGSSESGEKTH